MDKMKKLSVFLLFLALALSACAPSDKELASARVEEAHALLMDGSLNQALIVLDSVHLLYPKEVEVRREAKALQDTITYLQAQRNLIYFDSIHALLMPQVEPLLRAFRYEKNEKYESDGRFVHRLLNTDSNTSRCYLQAYVTENRHTIVKSYYAGSSRVDQTAFELAADGEVATFEGTNHSFESEGWHSLLTIEDDRALESLNFISSHPSARVRVALYQSGKTSPATVYYLTDSERDALIATYQLGFLLSDIRQAEEQIRIANAQIEKYAAKYAAKHATKFGQLEKK